MPFNEIFDPIYGKISFPKFINSLLYCPELLRLKEIRMSNINFFNFTGFSDTTRYEHAIGTAFLSSKMVENWDICESDKIEIITAALFHDVATPPFGHISESVYNQNFGFDHEEETAKIIFGKTSNFRTTSLEPIYAGEVPKLKDIYGKYKNVKLDIKNVFQYIKGEGKYGKVIKGNIDLDNIDNVVRAVYHIGLEVDKTLPYKLANSFIYKNGVIYFRYENKYLLNEWLKLRNELYSHLFKNTFDINREAILQYIINRAIQLKIMTENEWKWTDNELIVNLSERVKNIGNNEQKEFQDLLNRLKLGILFKEIGLFWVMDENFYYMIKDQSMICKIESDISKILKSDIFIKIMPDKRSREIGDFDLFIEGPLFEQSNKNSKSELIGRNLKNILICIYAINSTLIKKDEFGNAILDNNNSQIKYKNSELKNIVLSVLSDYVQDPHNIQIFNTKNI